VNGRVKLATAVAVLGVTATAGSAAIAGGGDRDFRASLSGFEEVPVVSTDGSGKFRAELRYNGDGEVAFRLRYRDLEGVANQAHIHLGQRGVNGGISVWLCGQVNNAPAGTPPCPPSPATVEGTFNADDVVGPAAQGIAPGEFDELVRAMLAGVTYANVHSDKFPGGEIRGQIHAGHGGR
jgi:hypothetical protein